MNASTGSTGSTGSVFVDENVLKLLLPFMSTNKTRPQICGMWVEGWKEEPILVATNGHALAAHHIGDNQSYKGEPFFVPNHAVKQALRVTCLGSLELFRDRIRVGATTIGFSGTDGLVQFDWRRAATRVSSPATSVLSLSQPNLRLLAEVAGRLKSHVTLHPHLDDVCIVTVDDSSWFFVVMPVRVKEDKTEASTQCSPIPEWAAFTGE